MICTGAFLIPGTQLLPVGVLAFAYFMALAYLFLGISIIAEVFMAGIEQITSQTIKVTVKKQDGTEVEKVVLLWNATVANLSLMALGSSAPEILLAVLETVSTLGGCPGELGASTIVGSAAFNLLVISGLSILAVTEENDVEDPRHKKVEGKVRGIKKINDMGVFTLSSAASIWAYLWLWIVLMDQNVEVWEAWVTFGSFLVLVVACYAADRLKAASDAKKDSLNEAKDGPTHEIYEYPALEIFKTLINEKQGLGPGKEDKAHQEKVQSMKTFLKDTMKTDQIEKVDLDELKK
jgi:solute carrier family 8 (sodium/calcium exchanger)